MYRPDPQDGFTTDDSVIYQAFMDDLTGGYGEDGDYADYDEYLDDFEDDGQPDEYTEWQDLYGGDDWDHGQYDEW